eukprot:9599861-Alexandrium_andersonii.AAC.1
MLHCATPNKFAQVVIGTTWSDEGLGCALLLATMLREAPLPLLVLCLSFCVTLVHVQHIAMIGNFAQTARRQSVARGLHACLDVWVRGNAKCACCADGASHL